MSVCKLRSVENCIIDDISFTRSLANDEYHLRKYYKDRQNENNFYASTITWSRLDRKTLCCYRYSFLNNNISIRDFIEVNKTLRSNRTANDNRISYLAYSKMAPVALTKRRRSFGQWQKITRYSGVKTVVRGARYHEQSGHWIILILQYHKRRYFSGDKSMLVWVYNRSKMKSLSLDLSNRWCATMTGATRTRTTRSSDNDLRLSP